MPYLILAYDNDNKDSIREEIRKDHRKYLESFGSKILASGALLNEKGNIIGGLTLFDTESKTEAEAFERNDPYSLIGIRKDVNIVFWRKRWWDGKFLLKESFTCNS